MQTLKSVFLAGRSALVNSALKLYGSSYKIGITRCQISSTTSSNDYATLVSRRQCRISHQSRIILALEPRCWWRRVFGCRRGQLNDYSMSLSSPCCMALTHKKPFSLTTPCSIKCESGVLDSFCDYYRLTHLTIHVRTPGHKQLPQRSAPPINSSATRTPRPTQRGHRRSPRDVPAAPHVRIEYTSFSCVRAADSSPGYPRDRCAAAAIERQCVSDTGTRRESRVRVVVAMDHLLI
jgi:hypothetical protein